MAGCNCCQNLHRRFGRCDCRLNKAQKFEAQWSLQKNNIILYLVFSFIMFQDLKQVQLKQRPSAFRPWSPKVAEKEKSSTQNEVER